LNFSFANAGTEPNKKIGNRPTHSHLRNEELKVDFFMVPSLGARG
jgi:hypothetical protein